MSTKNSLKRKTNLEFQDVLIQTPRLKLVPISLENTDNIYSEFTPTIAKYMVPAPTKGKKESIEFITNAISRNNKNKGLTLVINLKESGKFIGCCSLFACENPDTPNIGIWTKESSHGNNYGRETILGLTLWARENISYEYLVYPVSKENIPSIKIPLSLGGFEGSQRTLRTSDNRILNEIVFHIDLTIKLERDFILESPNLRLRVAEYSDIKPIFEATRVPGFNDGMAWKPPDSIDEMEEPFNRTLEKWGSGKSYIFSIVIKTTGEFCGRLEIRKAKDEDGIGTWELGYFTLPKHQKKGIMSEAIPLILKLGFETFKAKKIQAQYATWNIGSQKLLEKNGFKFVELIPEGLLKQGKWVPENKVEITYEDWVKAEPVD